MLEKGGQYRYTSTTQLKLHGNRVWFAMTVIHFEPDMRKAWVFMHRSKRHKVIDTHDKRFERFE